jgi:hypothetical protein
MAEEWMGDRHKFYATEASRKMVGPLLIDWIKRGVIIGVVVYYGIIPVMIGNYIPASIDTVLLNDVAIELGASRRDENCKRPNNTYILSPNLTDTIPICVKMQNGITKQNVEISQTTPYKSDDKTSEIEDAIVRIIMQESEEDVKIRRGILELGIKNFSRTNDTETLCIWCRTCKATSIAIECEHLVFCAVCLKEYRKNKYAACCPICIKRPISFEVFE